LISPSDLRTYVINLPRRPDRRAWIEKSFPKQLKATFTSDWPESFDGNELSLAALTELGYELFPWQIESDNSWWARPLKFGEIGCTLAHVACWRHAARSGDEPYTVLLEDDAILSPTFLDDLLDGLERVTQYGPVDLVYLGRFPLEPDRPALPGVVSPGYSHCTFGYVVTRSALATLLEANLEKAIVPVDEFLPSLYMDHPRQDLRARFPQRLTALAFEPPIVRQRPKTEAGSDTEDTPFVDLPQSEH
jgi:collagen beta-1,O-galactosyltransferase